MKKLSLLMLLFAFCVTLGLSQRTVTGVIADDTGEALIGVNVIEQGTTNGTITDLDGSFSLNVADDASTLVVSYTGFTTQNIDISGGLSNVNVNLSQGAILDEVVVTAFGIKKEKKALGYAVTELDEEVFQLQGESDVSRLLQGKVPGININPSGGFLGGSTNVIVRSKGSITGTNQPLYVVDGSPYTGEITDLDPNNIMNISVLKGLAASVLYGQEGRNGVILVTTKNGAFSDEDRLDISLTYNLTANDIANLPEYQNTYGNGADNNTVIGFVGNWGASFDPDVQVPHYYSIGRDASFVEAFPEFQDATVPYIAAPNNISDFFQTGIGHSTTLNVNSQKGNTALTFNLGYDDQTGYVDENTLKKTNLGLGILTKLTDKLTLKSNINYTNRETKRPDLGFFDRLIFLPRNLDIHNLPHTNPLDNSSAFYRTDLENPLWQLENQSNQTVRNRIYATVNTGYDISESLLLSYQVGYDKLITDRKSWSNKGGITGDNLIGWVESSAIQDETLDQNVQLRLKQRSITSDNQLQIGALLGTNLKSTKLGFDGLYSSGQLVYGIQDHDNFANHTPASHPFDGFTVSSNNDFIERVNVLGLYGQVDLSYASYLYLTLSGRNDWGSTLESENQSLFYPSASLALVVSDMVDMGPKIDFLKLRAGYATSAGFPNPYLTRSTLAANASAFVLPDGTAVSTNAVSPILANPGLRPELSREFEFGAELKMFRNRFGIDATVFNRRNEDQILAVTRPVSTGFVSSTINAGTIDTRGFELGVNVVPLKSNNFTWDIFATFTAFENEVIDLPEDNLDVFGGLNFAIEGEPLGTFRGTYAVRDDEGRLLINPNDGKIINSADLGLEDEIIGDPNEDWRASIINSLSYNGFTLTGQLEYVQGGDIFSVSANSLLRRGVTIDTEDREGTFVLPGVLADPNTGEVLTTESGNVIENTIQLGANDLYFLNTQDTDDASIYDATTIRLRRLSLSYSLPSNLMNRVKGVENIIFSVNANNLWFETPNMPKGFNLDPEVLGSTLTDRAQGIDFQNDPSYRKITASLKLNF